MQKGMKKYFWLFVLPTLIAFIIAFLVPFIMGIYLSFTKFTTVTNATFVGLENYKKIKEYKSGNEELLVYKINKTDVDL